MSDYLHLLQPHVGSSGAVSAPVPTLHRICPKPGRRTHTLSKSHPGIYALAKGGKEHPGVHHFVEEAPTIVVLCKDVLEMR